MRLLKTLTLAFALPLVSVLPAQAAEGAVQTAPLEAATAHLDGADLSLFWGIPFVGILLSIALMPLLLPRLWHHNFGKVAVFWALAFAIPFAAVEGIDIAGYELLHTLLLDYLPFLILIFTLFVVSGGILVSGNLIGTPNTNLSLLAFGTVIASLVGTTGASMLLIRPLLRANQERKTKVHVFVFFIFLVSNIGGSLTPLGDPPLFIGYLQGVDFGWTVEHMFGPMMLMSVVLLAVFYLIDSIAWRREGLPMPEEESRQIRIQGGHNILYLAGVVGVVLTTGPWEPEWSLHIWHLSFPLDSLVRDVALIAIAAMSLKSTRRSIRVENAFTWTPIQEVAILFLAIFLTMIPALAILRSGTDGALAGLAHFVTGPDGNPIPAAYFWLTGALSSFLDNAPTYLVFFNLAGGDPEILMGPLATTLAAISAGAVFMGANTYIGNAPNFMVKSICEEQGIRMPSFFGYMAWSLVCLGPLFIVLTFLFFHPA
ncbi:sodium:proton antiporter [Rhodospirillum centenum]|uniref:sodium:proton antiporter n=1 Tax=Rhodospirillum centenum TaxID=34018 RepID=UPI0011D05234|nr:sodium:proton antiporter [Rhodospirillum centenum]